MHKHCLFCTGSISLVALLMAGCPDGSVAVKIESDDETSIEVAATDESLTENEQLIQQFFGGDLPELILSGEDDNASESFVISLDPNSYSDPNDPNLLVVDDPNGLAPSPVDPNDPNWLDPNTAGWPPALNSSSIEGTVFALRHTFASLISLRFGMNDFFMRTPDVCPSSIAMLSNGSVAVGVSYFGTDGGGCSHTATALQTFFGGIPFVFDLVNDEIEFEFPVGPNPMIYESFTFDGMMTQGTYAPSHVDLPEGRIMNGPIDISLVPFSGSGVYCDIYGIDFESTLSVWGELSIDDIEVTLDAGDPFEVRLQDIEVDPNATSSFLPTSGTVTILEPGNQITIEFQSDTPQTREIVVTIGTDPSQIVTLPEFSED